MPFQEFRRARPIFEVRLTRPVTDYKVLILARLTLKHLHSQKSWQAINSMSSGLEKIFESLSIVILAVNRVDGHKWGLKDVFRVRHFVCLVETSLS